MKTGKDESCTQEHRKFMQNLQNSDQCFENALCHFQLLTFANVTDPINSMTVNNRYEISGASIDQRNCSGDHCTLISLGTVFPPYNKEKYDENGRRADGSQGKNENFLSKRLNLNPLSIKGLLGNC